MPESPVNPSEAIRFFEHLVEVFSGRKRRRTETVVERKGSLPFEKGRDPMSIGSVVSRTISERGWAPFLSRDSVIDRR
jgi:hypothetical protein